MSNKKISITPLNIYMLIIIVLITTIIILPIPVKILDVLMAMNLALALSILLLVILKKNKRGIILLPTITLISTLFSLAVNICATRLILLTGAEFNGILIRFVTNIMSGYGRFSWPISFILFAAIYSCHIFITSKGIVRVTGAAVKFALDNMPGRLMEIDKSFSSGAISREEAGAGKMQITQEADFFGALDGGGKFIAGNAKMGIIITAVIIIGGTMTDHMLRGYTIKNALETYAFLAIGCGILSIVPVFLVSLAVGIAAAGGGRRKEKTSN